MVFMVSVSYGLYGFYCPVVNTVRLCNLCVRLCGFYVLSGLFSYSLNTLVFAMMIYYRWPVVEANDEIVRRDIQHKVVGYRKDVDARIGLLLRTGRFLDLAQ
jgi:hypothetical protein